LSFHLANATLSIDGKTIISNGQLEVPVAMTGK
jgi:hypothetical protein